MTHDDALPALLTDDEIADAVRVALLGLPETVWRRYTHEHGPYSLTRPNVDTTRIARAVEQRVLAALAARGGQAWSLDTFRAMGQCPFCRYDHSVGPLCKHAKTMLDMLAAPPALPQGALLCRSDGRCQYAIDHGAEGLGHCPDGKCAMPLSPLPQGAREAMLYAIGTLELCGAARVLPQGADVPGALDALRAALAQGEAGR